MAVLFGRSGTNVSALSPYVTSTHSGALSVVGDLDSEGEKAVSIDIGSSVEEDWHLAMNQEV